MILLESIAGGALFFGLAAFIYKYYWLRIFAVAFLLLIWGSVAVIAPLVVISQYVLEGAVFTAILTAVVCVLLFLPWWMAFNGALEWVKREKEFDRWTKTPWNSG